MTNIASLFADSATVNVKIDGKGKPHKFTLNSPPTSVAAPLQQALFKVMQEGARAGVPAEHQGAFLAPGLMNLAVRALKACFPADSEEAQATDDDLTVLISRTGGLESELVTQAFHLCGLNIGKDDEEADPTPF